MNPMSPDPLASSDSIRHAKALRHAHAVTFNEAFALERGGALGEVQVVFETYGKPSPANDNAILICHALSGDSHVARHDDADDPGWWDLVVGPGKVIDTDRYFVICPNVLGGCRGTTGPNSINPATGIPYGADFPLVTVGDIVRLQARLVELLGIERLLAVVGGSLGGHMVLEWARRFPDRLCGAAALATSPRLTSQALAFDIVGRNAILRDPGYQGGQYYGRGSGPVVGLALARMLGHITYLSREAMTEKFDPHRLKPHQVQTQFETKFSVGSYLAYQGDRFVERFDANSYLTLTMAMDLFDLGEQPEQLAAAFAASTCRWLVVSFSTDWLFPPFQSRQLADALIAGNHRVSYCNVKTQTGHDAFLLPDELEIYGELLRGFLANLHDPADLPAGHRPPEGDDPSPLVATSIFSHHRLDYDSILTLIPPGTSVLDLGCGNGGLLARLRERGHTRIAGVELDERAIVDCVRRGFDVLQLDLNEGLSPFADGQFDCVVVSQTLQTVLDVERLLREVLRVGRYGVVSFPNLAYHERRRELAEEGRAPSIGAAYGFRWYNTPNVRFFSLADFEALCHERNVRIRHRVALDTVSGCLVDEDPNRNADLAILVISR